MTRAQDEATLRYLQASMNLAWQLTDPLVYVFGWDTDPREWIIASDALYVHQMAERRRRATGEQMTKAQDAAKEHPWCPACGAIPYTDEDGCCPLCGLDAVRPEVVARIRAVGTRRRRAATRTK